MEAEDGSSNGDNGEGVGLDRRLGSEDVVIDDYVDMRRCCY